MFDAQWYRWLKVSVEEQCYGISSRFISPKGMVKGEGLVMVRVKTP
jgi:hypothetical protein